MSVGEVGDSDRAVLGAPSAPSICCRAQTCGSSAVGRRMIGADVSKQISVGVRVSVYKTEFGAHCRQV